MCLDYYDIDFKTQKCKLCYKLFAIQDEILYPAFQQGLIYDKGKFLSYSTNTYIKSLSDEFYAAKHHEYLFNKILQPFIVYDRFKFLMGAKTGWDLNHHHTQYIILPITLFNVRYSGWMTAQQQNEDNRCYIGNSMIIHDNEIIRKKYCYQHDLYYQKQKN